MATYNPGDRFSLEDGTLVEVVLNVGRVLGIAGSISDCLLCCVNSDTACCLSSWGGGCVSIIGINTYLKRVDDDEIKTRG